MEERSEPKRSILNFLLSLPLRFKITIPYLIVASLLAGLATYLVGRSFVSTLEDRFRSQLEDASIRVSEGVLDVETAHLYMLRTIAFTMGVPDAVVDQDIDALRMLVFPHIVNDQLYFVDILGADGAPLATWHRIDGTSEYRENETASFSEWPLVRNVLGGESDEMGDKYVDIVETPWGWAIYTVGPIRTEEGLQGILLIGTPVSKMIFDLSKLGIANTTLYNSSGEALVSTFDMSTLDSLSDELRSGLPDAEEALFAREVSINQRGYIEAVKDLSLRGQPSGWFLGVALSESLVKEAQGPTTWQLIAIFAVGILALIGLGVVVAQLVAGPVFRLLAASQQVGIGNLEVHVDVQAEDEIGLLTRGFNRMVVDLQQREFIHEMFGRMVSEDVREAVLQNQVVLGGEVRDVTVLFTDVRGFTSMSERIAPEEIITLLNQFFNIVTTATHRHHGGVNHFGGDSILAVFGAPIERPLEETIQQAILAAIDIWRGVIELNARRIQSDLFPVRFGIGINSGPVVAGNIGSEDRFTYTVIGDVVNIAARLQNVSRQFPHTPLLIPVSGVKTVKDKLEVEFQHLSDVSLKGKEKPVPIYAILGSDKYFPSDLDIFDRERYPKMDVLMACYLYCLSYSTQVIAEVLQYSPQVVSDWLEFAAENAHSVGQILIDGFDLSPDKICRLEIECLVESSEKTIQEEERSAA